MAMAMAMEKQEAQEGMKEYSLESLTLLSHAHTHTHKMSEEDVDFIFS
jgi:hypothetical protein